MTPTAPTTPGQKRVERQKNKKLLDEARRFGAASCVTALVYDLLAAKLPALAEVEKLDGAKIDAAVKAGFDRAWSEFGAPTPES